MFADVIVDRPKLRRSVVARALQNKALQNFVSSTPLMQTPHHLSSEHSLNISPIDSFEKNGEDTHFVPIPQSKYEESTSKMITEKKHKG